MTKLNRIYYLPRNIYVSSKINILKAKEEFLHKYIGTFNMFEHWTQFPVQELVLIVDLWMAMLLKMQNTI